MIIQSRVTRLLTRLKIFSGGPLSRVIGDALAAEGVHLMQVFGMYVPDYDIEGIITSRLTVCVQNRDRCSQRLYPEIRRPARLGMVLVLESVPSRLDTTG